MILEQTFLAEHDYYEVMGLGPEATVVQIEAAFKEQAAGLNLRHPDLQERVQAAEKMLTLTQAYETLSDPMLRSRYDRHVLGRNQLPISIHVENLFKEGLRAWRKGETDLALRYLKEVANLYPHRALYRVHLAIAYADKDWYTFTESELETALRLDPDFGFAKETVAKLLFKLPDKRRHWHQNALNRQVATLAAGLVGLGVLIASGLPQSLVSNTIDKISAATKAQPQGKTLEEQLPADLRKEFKQQDQTATSFEIPFFDSAYVPEGKIYDYTKLEAKTKVYYPDQQMVVLTYKDGSILTYKPASLKGWKKTADLPIMITANNELIPSPSSLPLLMPDQKPADLQASDFPVWMFPEYGVTPSSASGTSSSSNSSSYDTSGSQSTQSVDSSDYSDTPPSTPSRRPSGGYNPYGN